MATLKIAPIIDQKSLLSAALPDVALTIHVVRICSDHAQKPGFTPGFKSISSVLFAPIANTQNLVFYLPLNNVFTFILELFRTTSREMGSQIGTRTNFRTNTLIITQNMFGPPLPKNPLTSNSLLHLASFTLKSWVQASESELFQCISLSTVCQQLHLLPHRASKNTNKP